MNERFLAQMEFLRWCEGLKAVERRSHVMGLGRRENSAEHSWHVMLLAVVLAEHANEKIDLLRVLKMLVIHDLVEIECGDVFFYAKTSANCESELQAAHALFAKLPKDQGDELLALWLEFEARESADAKYASSVDRIWPVIQNIHNEGGTWVEYKLKLEESLKKLEIVDEGSKVLWEYVKVLTEQGRGRGFFVAE